MKMTLDHTQRLNLHALLGAQRADVGSIRAIWAVQDKLAADAPWVPIAHGELVVAARAELSGVVLSPTGHPIYSLIRRTEGRSR